MHAVTATKDQASISRAEDRPSRIPNRAETQSHCRAAVAEPAPYHRPPRVNQPATDAPPPGTGQRKDACAAAASRRRRRRCVGRAVGPGRIADADQPLQDPPGADRIKQARKDQGASNATVNRMLSVPRAILRRAEMDWEWLDRAPKVRLLPEPSRRVRWLHQEEAERLIAELPKHLKAMARFTLATGLRQGNVKGLRWSQVDLDRRIAWIHADQAKGRKAIAVPLNAEAMKVLERQLGKNPSYVFTYGGTPVKQVNTKAWKAALRRAGVEDFHWHDLRHTWASWHVQQGTPLHVLQELGGWETVDMVRRYAHLAAEHTAHYAERTSRSFAENDPSAGTNLAHAER